MQVSDRVERGICIASIHDTPTRCVQSGRRILVTAHCLHKPHTRKQLSLENRCRLRSTAQPVRVRSLGRVACPGPPVGIMTAVSFDPCF